MKKSSLVLLTIVAALSFSSCAEQSVAQNIGPPDPVYADAVSDTTKQQPMVAIPAVEYDYYYRSYFFDDMFRWFFPNRYYGIINQPGYVPRHKRPIRSDQIAVHHSRSMPSSHLRGGFGRTGSTHAAAS
jgi:hypothetical protein